MQWSMSVLAHTNRKPAVHSCLVLLDPAVPTTFPPSHRQPGGDLEADLEWERSERAKAPAGRSEDLQQFERTMLGHLQAVLAKAWPRRPSRLANGIQTGGGPVCRSFLTPLQQAVGPTLPPCFRCGSAFFSTTLRFPHTSRSITALLQLCCPAFCTIGVDEANFHESGLKNDTHRHTVRSRA